MGISPLVKQIQILLIVKDLFPVGTTPKRIADSYYSRHRYLSLVLTNNPSQTYVTRDMTRCIYFSLEVEPTLPRHPLLAAAHSHNQQFLIHEAFKISDPQSALHHCFIIQPLRSCGCRSAM